MKSSLPTTKFLSIALLVAVSLFLKPSYVSAQIIQELTIAPARQQIELAPGESSTVIFKLINSDDTPVVGTLTVVDFIVNTADGKPQFLEGPLKTFPRYAASTWFTLPYNRMSIPGNDKVETQVKITAPANALPGGHYSAIIFEPIADPTALDVPGEAGQSAIAPRIAGLVYVVVPGAYEETALVTEFSAPGFSQFGPIDIKTAITNTSPVHIRPSGSITITNMFNDVVTNLPFEEANIFPDASKNYLNTVPTKWLVGRYRADLYLAYGTQGKVLQGTTYFVVFPVILVVAIIVLVLLIIFIAKMLIKRGNKHEQELQKEVEELKKEVETLEQKP